MTVAAVHCHCIIVPTSLNEKWIKIVVNVTKTQNSNQHVMNSLPPLYALRAFEAAVRLGSFSKASKALNLTPGAVSRHVRTLEAWFECSLFIRNGPQVTPTAKAQHLALQLHKGFSTLEQACRTFNIKPYALRLKSPSTLTIRWLLDALKAFHQTDAAPAVDIASVWMDTDTVDFNSEPYDCAILLGRGEFGTGTQSQLLFEEWLIPVCAPALLDVARSSLSACELIHPSPDRRDWTRWLSGTGRAGEVDIMRGKVFDTLEQGSLAAISGHGVAIADLLLSHESITSGLLKLPFSEAVATGDSYYFVWPEATPYEQAIDTLYHYLKTCAPACFPRDIYLV